MKQNSFLFVLFQAMGVGLLVTFSASCAEGERSVASEAVETTQGEAPRKRLGYRPEELQALGLEVQRIIQTEDLEAFLRFLRPEWAVRYGPGDTYFGLEEIHEQFENRRGFLYCSLFDTKCYRELHQGTYRDEATSLKETLATVEWELKVDTYHPQISTAYVRFLLKPDLRSIGRLQDPTFEFGFDDAGWFLTGVEVG